MAFTDEELKQLEKLVKKCIKEYIKENVRREEPYKPPGWPPDLMPPFPPDWAPPTQGHSKPTCPKCGITLSDVMMYVCYQNPCPTGLGGVIS